MLTAIPTVYRDIRFRSRQEARWAVLFDALDMEWVYEAEGFQLPTYWYLPDFWLPNLRAFAEVKGIAAHWGTVELTKARELAQHSGRPVLLCDDISVVEPSVIAICSVDGEHEQLRCDLVMSADYGRCWLDAGPGADNATLDDWSRAANEALHMRFGRDYTGRCAEAL